MASAQRDDALRQAAASRRAAELAQHKEDDARRQAEDTDRRWPERRAELAREYDRRTDDAVRTALARQQDQVKSLREQLQEEKAAREGEVQAVRLAAQREGIEAEAKITDAQHKVAAAQERGEAAVQRARTME